MLDKVIIGASVSMTPKEADSFCGDGGVRLVTCPSGRVIGGIGSVGFLEHTGVSDLQEFIDKVKAKRAALAELAAAPEDPKNLHSNLYTFIKI